MTRIPGLDFDTVDDLVCKIEDMLVALWPHIVYNPLAQEADGDTQRRVELQRAYFIGMQARDMADKCRGILRDEMYERVCKTNRA